MNNRVDNGAVAESGQTAGGMDFVGLAPFLRMSIAGEDFLPQTREMLAAAQTRQDDASLWMNLATALLCLNEHRLGLAAQAQAIEMRRTYLLPAIQQPPAVRVLVLCMAGDLSANAPIDCLLENMDVDLYFHYVSPNTLLNCPLPEHDAVFVAISASDESAPLFGPLAAILADWPKPVINLPQCVPTTERRAASLLLQDAPGLLICQAHRADRAMLESVASGEQKLAELFPGHEFPVIVRPVGSHGGRGLDRLDTPQAIPAYLAGETDEEFFVSRYIDYRNADGLFRKYRVVLVDGVPYACHMAVSSHWMVHYVNAEMYENPQRRGEEAWFFEHFDEFVTRHQAALSAIAERTGLDYVGIDCSETPDGSLLVFEIDHAMVVHAMDSETLFPHKQVHMQKVRDAFRSMLLQRVAQAHIKI